MLWLRDRCQRSRARLKSSPATARVTTSRSPVLTWTATGCWIPRRASLATARISGAMCADMGDSWIYERSQTATATMTRRELWAPMPTVTRCNPASSPRRNVSRPIPKQRSRFARFDDGLCPKRSLGETPANFVTFFCRVVRRSCKRVFACCRACVDLFVRR